MTKGSQTLPALLLFVFIRPEPMVSALIVASAAGLSGCADKSGHGACVTCCDCTYQCGVFPENTSVIANPNAPDRCMDCNVACGEIAYGSCMAPVISAGECKSNSVGQTGDASAPQDALPPGSLEGTWVHAIDSTASKIYEFHGQNYSFSDGPYFVGNTTYYNNGTWRMLSGGSIGLDGLCRDSNETGIGSLCTNQYSFAYVNQMTIEIDGEKFTKVAGCIYPTCLASLASTCEPSGTCVEQVDPPTDSHCYSNGVKEITYIGGGGTATKTYKNGSSTCYSIDFAGITPDLVGQAALTFKDASGSTIATGTWDIATNILTITCPGEQPVVPLCGASVCTAGACAP